MESDLEQSGQKCKALETEILEAKSRMDDLQSAKNATEAKYTEVNSLLASSKQQVEAQMQVEAKMKAEKETLQQDLSKTQVDLEAQNETCLKLEMSLEAKTKTLEDLSHQMSQNEESLEKLKVLLMSAKKITIILLNTFLFFTYFSSRNSKILKTRRKRLNPKFANCKLCWKKKRHA